RNETIQPRIRSCSQPPRCGNRRVDWGMLPFVFSGTAINAVSVGAYRMVEEVRRQFREIPGLREGTAKPNYAAAVDISTRTTLVGDAVRRPWKDTDAPCLHILIKRLNAISLVFTPIFLVAPISLA